MAVGSVIVGVLALLLTFAGLLPVFGVVSLFAPVAAIAGIVMGGLALSRAKQDGAPTGAATAGLVVNIVAVIPAIAVALTCGLCNACMTAGAMNPSRGTGPYWMDGGMGFGPGPGQPGSFGPSGKPTDPFGDPNAPGKPADPAAGDPSAEPTDPDAPPPAFPPPPMEGDDTTSGRIVPRDPANPPSGTSGEGAAGAEGEGAEQPAEPPGG